MKKLRIEWYYWVILLIGVLFLNSKFQFLGSLLENPLVSFDGSRHAIYSLGTYDGKLYAGQGQSSGDGDVLVFDGSSWSTSYDGYIWIRDFKEYDGKLYAVEGYGTVANVIVFDGSSWSTSFSLSGSNGYDFMSLEVYDGKLYAGSGYTSGRADIYVFDGSSWSLAYHYEPRSNSVYSLKVYDGKLYAGISGVFATDGDILVFDGSSWSVSYEGSKEEISCLEVYDGKLYAGQGQSSGDGDVLVFDGSSWSTSYDGSTDQVLSLHVYNGELYAGLGSSAGDGNIISFDGSSWSVAFDGSQEAILSLADYDGSLYAGQGTGIGDGDVILFEGPPTCPVIFRQSSSNWNVNGNWVAYDKNDDGSLDGFGWDSLSSDTYHIADIEGYSALGNPFTTGTNVKIFYQPPYVEGGNEKFGRFSPSDSDANFAVVSSSPTEPYTSLSLEVYDPTGVGCPDLDEPPGSYCTVDSECVSDECVGNVCTSPVVVSNVQLSVSANNLGNTDLNMRLDGVVGDSVFVNGFVIGEQKNNVLQGSSAVWTSSIIDVSGLADGVYPVQVEVCGLDVAGILTEVCHTYDVDINVAGGGYVP